jgi:hypothetical protein
MHSMCGFVFAGISQEIPFLSPFNLFPEKLYQVWKMFTIPKSACLYIERHVSIYWYMPIIRDVLIFRNVLMKTFLFLGTSQYLGHFPPLTDNHLESWTD